MNPQLARKIAWWSLLLCAVAILVSGVVVNAGQTVPWAFKLRIDLILTAALLFLAICLYIVSTTATTLARPVTQPASGVRVAVFWSTVAAVLAVGIGFVLIRGL